MKFHKKNLISNLIDILKNPRNYYKILNRSELGTLEWITFNPNYLSEYPLWKLLILVLNPLFFSLFGYQYIVFSNESAGI